MSPQNQRLSSQERVHVAGLPALKDGRRPCLWCGDAVRGRAVLIAQEFPRRMFRAYHPACARDMAQEIEQIATFALTEQAAEAIS